MLRGSLSAVQMKGAGQACLVSGTLGVLKAPCSLGPAIDFMPTLY